MFRHLRFVVAALAFLTYAAAAEAQVQSSRRQVAPPSAENSASSEPRTLDLNVTLAEGYDSDAAASLGSISQSSPRVGSYYSELQTSGAYQWRRERVQVAATGASTVRYFQELSRLRNIGSSGGLGFSAQVARRTAMSFSGTAAYSPSYLYGLFPTGAPPMPGDAIPSAPDYGSNTESTSSYAYGARFGLSQEVGAASALSLTADYLYTDFVHETDVRRDLANYGISAEYTHNVSRHNTVTLAYRHRQGEFRYAIGHQSMENGVDAGMQIAHPLSATRSLTFAFKVGTSAVDVPATVAAASSDVLYRATANANISYDFKRSWQLRGTYRRGLDYLAVLTEPVFTDGVSTSIDGFVTPRTLFRTSAGYSRGVSALNLSSSRPFTTYTGTVRVTQAMSQTLSVYVEYLYYYYDFRGTAALQPGLPRSLDRSGARLGLTFWFPVRSR